MSAPRYAFAPPPVPAAAIAGTDELFPVRRIFCVGRNYAAHAREMGKDPDREPPFFFTKPADALVSGDATIAYPPLTSNLHFEGELVVAIGKGGANIARDAALDHVFGYACGNDLTRRDLQNVAKDMARPWDWAKAFDRSAPCGPIVRASEVGQFDSGAIRTLVNGVEKQSADLADMIWPVADVIAFLSQAMEIAPGDLIFTGTPAGVGRLEPGDICVIEIDRLPPLKTTIAPRG
ncbi:MAG: fumarylacetoacetate hydrolase family protein [Mesorhizobium sp.]